MAVTGVDRVGMEDSFNESSRSSYRVKYHVFTDSPQHEPDDIAFYSQIPQKGDQWHRDGSYVVTNRSIKKNPRQPKMWLVDITYELNQYLDQNNDETVFDKPDKIQFYPQFSTQVMTVARKGAIRKVSGEVITADPDDDTLYPVRNSSGYQNQPPPTEEVLNLNFKLVRIYRGWDIPVEVFNLVDRTNSAPVRVRNILYPAGTLKMQPFNNEENTTEDGTNYLVMTIPFSHNPNGWNHLVPDMGNMEKDGKHIRDKSGLPVQEPVRLDGSGKQLGSFDDIKPDGDTVIIEWKPKQGSGDYSALELPE